MDTTKVGIGKYEGNYKDFLFSIEKVKSRNWQSIIFIKKEDQQIAVPLDRSSSKKEALDLIVLCVDNPSQNPALFSSLDFKNLTYEDVSAFFIAQEYQQIQSPFRIKRIQKGKERYYTVLDEVEPKFYMSVTSFTSRALNSFQLNAWREKLGSELADKKSADAAEYGTFMHIQICDFIKNGQYNFDNLDDVVCDYIVGNGLELKFIGEWIGKLHNDMLSFAQFCNDKQVQTIAVEFPIVSDRYKLGGQIDYVCSFLFRGKRVNAVLDFKSGRKGFYDAHEMQVKLYKDMWNDLFGDIVHLSHAFNWSPKEWRGCTPTYNLKNQTDGKIQHELYVSIALKEDWIKEPKPMKRGVGLITLGEEIKSNVMHVTMSDYIKGRKIRK